MAEAVPDAEWNGSLLSLNGSKAWLELNESLLNASSELDGGAGAARRGVVLLACFGGAGLGGGALLFFGGSAGVGLSDFTGGVTVCEEKGSTPKGSDCAFKLKINVMLKQIWFVLLLLY